MTSIYVDDQDAALDFYTSKLGFEVATDASYGSGGRWLSVKPPGDPAEVELLLEQPDGPAAALQQARYDAGRPSLSITVDDCRAAHQALKGNGVSFSSDPSERPYGGIDAVFDDTCGNLINLHQVGSGD